MKSTSRTGVPIARVASIDAPAQTILTAGVTLNAVDAIRNRDQQHFTRAQVAYLIHLAYETGRTHAATEDMAEVVACWDEFAEARPTREQRVQRRLDEMAAGAERQAQRPKTYPTLDVDWPDVVQPGSKRQAAA